MSNRTGRTAAIVGAAVLVASAGFASAYQLWNWRVRERTQLQLPDVAEETVLPPKPGLDAEAKTGERTDDARARQLASRRYWGPRSGQHSAELLRIARQEAARWPTKMPRARTPLNNAPLPATGLEWLNLGPTDAALEWNGNTYNAVDSGRPVGIAVDPTHPSIVYLATCGGGVWKTYQFGQPNPEWIPITETLGQISLGALAMDPSNPQTLYVGIGDPFDSLSDPGGTVVKTTDGGGTWSTGVLLTGTVGAQTLTAGSIRSIQVDPNNPANVWVGTDVGLFVSRDGGSSFTLVDLPNKGGATLAEAIWSIAYLGKVNGNASWAVSGVYACAAGATPPQPGFGQIAGSTCAGGNPGDIWRTTDGQTWTSGLAANSLPATAVGRIDLAAGTPSTATPPVTVLYAQLAGEDETQPAGAGYWRSMNSAQAWQDATGTLANTSQDCPDTNVNGQQAWYNQTISVDPGDNARVIAGGMLCGLRTLNGTAASPTWESVSDWLPVGGGGGTSAGTLPYVHADWHTTLIVRNSLSPTGYWVFVGSDGGLFHSTNVFGAGSPTDQTVTWTFANRGLVTHLGYSIASGDPTNGTSNVALFGLQDNGTRIRSAAANASTTFNQIFGGDGIGTSFNKGTAANGATMLWVSAEFSRGYCVADDGNGTLTDCTQPNWQGNPDDSVMTSNCSDSATNTTDQEPFFMRYAPLQTDPTGTGVLSVTTYGVFRSTGLTPSWVQLGGCFAPAAVRNVEASQTDDGIYGVALSGGKFAFTHCPLGTNTTVPPPDGGEPVVSACTWTTSQRVWVDLNGNGTQDPNELLKSTSQLTFPPGSNGKTYVGASVAVTADDGKPVDPRLGHIWLTTNGGTSWTPIHGNGTSDLPNIGVESVKFDPSDSTGKTLYAGTELGVYRSSDLGQTWERFGSGMPLVRVMDLYVSLNGGMVRATTYGRGVWEVYPSATAERGVSGDGDFDRNLQLDFFDVMAMCERLGTTPATAGQPTYDWNLDVTGSTNQLDDTDLQTLLGRLGGTP